MWNEVGQSLSLSMTKMLDQFASLLPGVLALIAALLVSALIAWAFSAILRRSLTGLDFDRRVARWGFPAYPSGRLLRVPRCWLRALSPGSSCCSVSWSASPPSMELCRRN